VSRSWCANFLVFIAFNYGLLSNPNVLGSLDSKGSNQNVTGSEYFQTLLWESRCFIVINCGYSLSDILDKTRKSKGTGMFILLLVRDNFPFSGLLLEL
jgi:hypothetical protein